MEKLKTSFESLSRSELRFVFGGTRTKSGNSTCQEHQVCCTDDWEHYYCQNRGCGTPPISDKPSLQSIT